MKIKFALFFSALILIGCAGERDDNTTTICFAFQDLETEFWVASHRAIIESLEEKGVRVVERNASEDANRQLEQIRDAIAQQVDGIILIPQDGESAVTIIGEANKAGIPIAVFNRPPAENSHTALVVVSDNVQIAEKAVAFMAEEAKKKNREITPLIVVGDLGDPNAVQRRQGFFNIIENNPGLFKKPIEVPSKWDATTTLANLEAALQAHPEVDFIFTSSDFLYPQIRAVLQPIGKWRKRGEEGHVILGGLDGDQLACRWMKEGYVDATGVQDLFFEADTLLSVLLRAIAAGEKRPSAWINDPGFALTLENLSDRENEMWGCRLLQSE